MSQPVQDPQLAKLQEDFNKAMAKVAQATRTIYKLEEELASANQELDGIEREATTLAEAKKAATQEAPDAVPQAG